MARSVWKGPFVEESLMKKVDKYKDDPKKIPIKTWSRKSTILHLLKLQSYFRPQFEPSELTSRTLRPLKIGTDCY